MSRSHPVDAPVTGEIMAPHEWNAEMREISGALHELDNHNFAYFRITEARVAPGTWGSIWISRPATIPVSQAHQPGDNSVRVFHIPKETSDEPWTYEVDTGDGGLVVSLAAWWGNADTVDEDPLWIWLGIRVDGVIVAQTPLQNFHMWEYSELLRVEVPVRAGKHLIELIYGLHDASLLAAETITWRDRTSVAREVAR